MLKNNTNKHVGMTDTNLYRHVGGGGGSIAAHIIMCSPQLLEYREGDTSSIRSGGANSGEPDCFAAF